jgi:hypothetical protein
MRLCQERTEEIVKKAMAMATVAASVVGVSATSAPGAGHRQRQRRQHRQRERCRAVVRQPGDGRQPESPALGSAGLPDKLCAGLPAKGDVGSVVGLLDNIPVLSGNGAGGS